VESPFAGDKAKVQPNYSLGVFFAVLTSCCNVGMAVFRKYEDNTGVTPYTSNFVSSVVGVVVMAALLLFQKKPFVPSFPSWKSWYFAYGVADWFFMWGTVRSLMLVDLNSWGTLTSCLNQALIMIVAAAFLGEAIGFFNLGVLARNLLVLTLVSKPAFIFGGDDQSTSVPLAGLGFLFVQCTGAAFSSAIQRHLCNHPTETIIFWGFLANVLYWFPPGVMPPDVRIPFLWPTVGEDLVPVPFNVKLFSELRFTLPASIFQAFWYVFAGYGLIHMGAADFYLLLVPLGLVLSCITSFTLFHENIDGLSWLALGIIACGFALDHWWESTSRKQQSESVDETSRLAKVS